MSAITSAAFSRPARIGAVLAVAAATLVAVAPPSSAAASAVTLSASSGPSGGTNTITLTGTGAVWSAGSVVEFAYSTTATAPVATTCAATYQTPAAVVGASAAATTGIVAVASPKILSSSKMAVTIPAGLAIPGGSSAASLNFTVCVYAGATAQSALKAYGKTKYAIAAAPTVSAVSPAGAPALGGGTVTVTGTNFINGATTATLGGAPLTNITVVDATTFTGTVPARTAGSTSLSVTTTGGTVNKPSFFTYSDGLVVTPATGPSNSAAPIDLDILGVGFTEKSFTTTTGTKSNDGNAHVYLVPGAYNPALLDDDADATTPSVKTVGQVAECTNVLVISDTELICSLDTATSLNAANANTFLRTVTDAVTTNTDETVTSAIGGFAQDDVGKLVVGTGIAPGSVIDSVTDSNTIELDQAATAGGTVSVTVGADSATNAADIADGTYTVTIVSDGRPGATKTVGQPRTNAAYTPPSIISSGSTFTVAPY